MRAKKRFGFIFLLFLIVILLAFGIFFTRIWLPAQVRADFGSPDPELGWLKRLRFALELNQNKQLLLEEGASGAPERKFDIAMAEPVNSVCSRLESEGFVRSAGPTCTFLIYTGLDRQVQAGTFTLDSDLNAVQVARKIGDASQRDILFTVFPGWRLEEVGEAVDGNNFTFGSAEFVAFVTTPPKYFAEALVLPAAASLEGYLFPGSYSFKPDITLEDMTKEILTQFSLSILDESFQNGLASQGINVHQAVILASIIQRETSNVAEMPMIASVFSNRLEVDMPLQTDPTVQYSLGYDAVANTWWPQPLSLADLGVDSPYNTYQVNGLPPGPICSPSMETLLAVAMPAETPYYFFRAKCDGSMTHDFSITYEEHLNKACP